MPDAIFICPDLSSFAGLDELGLVQAGRCLEPDRAVLAARVVEPDDWCHRCGCLGCPRDRVRTVGARAVWLAADDASGEGVGTCGAKT